MLWCTGVWLLLRLHWLSCLEWNTLSMSGDKALRVASLSVLKKYPEEERLDDRCRDEHLSLLCLGLIRQSPV